MQITERQHVFVNFNAWNYSGSDVLWAGLVKEIIETNKNVFIYLIYKLLKKR